SRGIWRRHRKHFFHELILYLNGTVDPDIPESETIRRTGGAFALHQVDIFYPRGQTLESDWEVKHRFPVVHEEFSVYSCGKKAGFNWFVFITSLPVHNPEIIQVKTCISAHVGIPKVLHKNGRIFRIVLDVCEFESVII